MIYEYYCDSCGKQFEVKRSIKDTPSPVNCPQCGKVTRRKYSPLNNTWGRGCWQFGEDGLGDEPCHNW